MNADQFFPQILKQSAKIVKQPVLPNQAQIQASLEIVLQKKKENNFLWFCLTKVASA